MKKLLVLFILVLSIGLLSCDKVTTTSETTTTTSSSTSSDDTTTTTTTTANSAGYTGIQVINILKTDYYLGTEFDYSTITVVLVKSNGLAFPIGSSVYTLSGFDSSTPGEQTLTVSYQDFSTTFEITIITADTGLVIDMAYYAEAQGLIGETLLLKLREIINANYQGHIYTDASYFLDDTDEDPSNTNNVILVYSGKSVSGAWDGGTTWNKEHVWPQSLLGEDAGSVVNMASDLQNLKPADPSWNSSRGNKYYDYVGTTSAVAFEPRDEVKGDVARILFYMMTMYEVLELVDQYPNLHQMGLLSVLLEWNELDPVDNFERRRNELIFDYQNNRNPYIDYPGLVNLVWDNL